MNHAVIQTRLADLPLGDIRYHERIGSTNDDAAQWALNGAPNLSLVIADEQTAGKGRAGRQWFTAPGAALAFSLILFPTLEDGDETSPDILPRMTALGALAVCDALRNVYKLPAQIKWPNDVILNRRKVAGILAEAQWTGNNLAAVVLGIGINVAPASISEVRSHLDRPLPASQTRFPPTCVDEALGHSVDRLDLLYSVLVEFLRRRQRMGWPDFMKSWESSLAFRGEWVQVFAGQGSQDTGALTAFEEGRIVGLTRDGSLKLATRSGNVVTVQFGEMRLRPVDVSKS